MRKPVVIDIETKYSFREQPDTKKLGVSVAGLYDYKSNSYNIFFESDLPKFFSYIEQASIVVGFNINSFDMIVLNAYYPGELQKFETLDILDDIKKKTGTRYALNDLLKETLQKKKSGHGLEALNLYRSGKYKELTRYCLDDVRLTKELFEYGVSHSKIYYPSSRGRQEVVVNWREKIIHSKKNQNVSLTLPF